MAEHTRISSTASDSLHHAGAFVVQFRASTDFDLGNVSGRVEHVASGHTANFDSLKEMLDVITLVLNKARGHR